MREPNLGTYISCNVCRKMFWTEDGYPICSSECDRIAEDGECPHCGDEKDPDADACESCCECPVCGEEKTPNEDYCGGDACKEEEEE